MPRINKKKTFKNAIGKSVFNVDDWKKLDERQKSILIKCDADDSDRWYFKNEGDCQYRNKFIDLIEGKVPGYKFAKAYQSAYKKLEFAANRKKPHMLAVYSSSRIGFFHFLDEYKNNFLDKHKNMSEEKSFEAEYQIEKRQNIGGEKFTLDFHYPKKGTEAEDEYFVETKCCEILTKKFLDLSKSYKGILKGEDIYESPLKDNLLSWRKDKNGNDTDELRLQLKLPGEGGEEVVRSSRVNFAQMLKHLIGISTRINEEQKGKKNLKKKYHLKYIFFMPRIDLMDNLEKGLVGQFKEEIANDIAAFKGSKFYTQLKHVNNEDGPLVLDVPQFIEVEPDLILYPRVQTGDK